MRMLTTPRVFPEARDNARVSARVWTYYWWTLVWKVIQEELITLNRIKVLQKRSMESILDVL